MLSRRDFINDMLLTSALIQSGIHQAKAFSKSEKRIAIQIGAVSFVDEGEEQVLDNVQNLAGINFYNNTRRWWRILDANPKILFGADLMLKEYIGETIQIPRSMESGGGS